MVTLNITRIVRGKEKDILAENEFCPKYEYGSLMPIYAGNIKIGTKFFSRVLLVSMAGNLQSLIFTDQSDHGR